MKLFGRKHEGAGGEPAEAYDGLRTLALNLTAEALGANAPPDPAVIAVLMESGLSGGAVATLVGVADGTTSMYYSTGGGMIGAGARADVAAATHRWLEVARGSLDRLSPVTDPPLPAEGMAQFVVVTPGGLLSGVAPAAELGERRHLLSPLFFAGHGVITQIRLSQAA
jgi:hypothetical protein